MLSLLTKVLGLGVNITFSLIVQQQVVDLHVKQHHVSSGQFLLSGLNHGDLLSKHARLTERHVSLHP
jgi:hypothetical protein